MVAVRLLWLTVRGYMAAADDDGSGGESHGMVWLAELQVLPVSYYILSYKARCRKERRCRWFCDST